MAGHIPRHFIDELMQRTDIVELIGSRVALKKAGREYTARCPFHDEKTASFTVSPDKGFYHCFGCNAHGTAIDFLMEYDRLDFVSAIEELALRHGVEVPREGGGHQRSSGFRALHALLDRAAGHFEAALRQHQPAIDYLRGRGLDGATAARFRIGYAAAGWDNLLRAFDTGEESRKQLLAAGLITAREGRSGHYDRFRDRIMFPIRDRRGRVLGFGGRALDDDGPKYLNSPETAVFHKGRELYGLHEACQAERGMSALLVVEGYMDVVMLSRHGIHNVVATLGTATTGEHLQKLLRIVPEVIFCFDGDRAGRAAAWRALQAALPELRDGRQVRFLFVPEGEDPDSLVRSEGAAGFRKRMGEAMELSDYLLDELLEQAGGDSLDGRARMAELARPLLDRLPPGVYRELLHDRLARAVGLSTTRLSAALGDGKTKASGSRRRGQRQPARRGGRASLVGQAIRLVLSYPAIAAQLDCPPELASVQVRGAELLLEIIGLAQAQPALGTAALLERFRDRPEGEHLQALLATPVPVDEEGALAELRGSLGRILALDHRQRLDALLAKAGSEGLNDEEKAEFRRLQQARLDIRQKR